MFFISAFRSHFIFLNFQAYVFLAQKQHTWLQKLFFTSKNSCKEYFVERKQIKSTTAAYTKLRMFGGKTCHVCTQLEHVSSSRIHATDGITGDHGFVTTNDAPLRLFRIKTESGYFWNCILSYTNRNRIFCPHETSESGQWNRIVLKPPSRAV